MVKHIILWNLKEEFNTDKIKNDMKLALEGLVGQIDGLITLKVEINPFTTSNTDVMLYSEFENELALKNYAVHPKHVEVADTKVRPYTKVRTVFDFEQK
ncbi:MAG: Dabb family protein [Clostridia bacterium]|nr:Dabb family protein [Clostridia bacterium]